MSDAKLFRLNHAPSNLEDVVVFLSTSVASEGMKALEKKQLAIRTMPYMLMSGDLYQLGQDEVLRQCVLEHERKAIMEEGHGGITGGNYERDVTTCKILLAGLWWEILYKDCKEYYKACDHCQHLGKPEHRDEMPLRPIASKKPFEKWEIEFVGPISLPVHKTKSRYIITCIDYLTRWV
ncbi:hypothetical protein KI387_023704 [Taxus chinensis]|uniref:Integrase zinc-binding domain-containing protein n=1 Tax=Taxus chinensis TaxID=29808 RepID=A0AA38G261_TAXCH|nr:hypothetical protein KI387_023704 [Taxus chinensis]